VNEPLITVQGTYHLGAKNANVCPLPNQQNVQSCKMKNGCKSAEETKAEYLLLQVL